MYVKDAPPAEPVEGVLSVVIHMALCSDQPEQLASMQAACACFAEMHPEHEFAVETYARPLELLRAVGEGATCHVALLEAAMAGISGIEVARELRTLSPRTELVFLSDTHDHAAEAFAVDARHYLLRPFTQDAFDEALLRALRSFDDDRVMLLAVPEVGGGVRRINVRNISYVESFRSERCLYVGDASVRTRLSLQSIQAELDKLCPGRFIAPFRGHLVNLDAVASVASTCITLVDGRIVPLKAGAFRKTRACYFDWLFHKEGHGE